jgi:hypothetical protein
MVPVPNPPSPWRAALAAAFLGSSVPACDPGCDPPSRIDGRYAAGSTVGDESQVTGTNLDLYPMEDAFIDRFAEWDFTWRASASSFELTIDGQPFTATYDENDPDDCSSFAMTIEGIYVTEAQTSHEFQWAGDLTYFGTHITGPFTYDDTWEDAVGTGGSIHVPAGEMSASLLTDDDTTD